MAFVKYLVAEMVQDQNCTRTGLSAGPLGRRASGAPSV